MSQKFEFQLFPKEAGIWAYIYLLYLVIPVYSLKFYTLPYQVIGIFLFGIFIIAYRELYFGDKYFTFWLMVQIVMTFFFSMKYHPFYLFMGFFPANFIGLYRKRSMFYSMLIILIMSQLIPFFLHFQRLKEHVSEEFLFLFPALLFVMFMIPFGVQTMRKQQDLKKQLSSANEQIHELIKQEERTRISRDLHDTLGHTLSLITLKGQVIERLIFKNPERAEKEAKEMTQTARMALNQVRELVTTMRPIMLDEELNHVQIMLDTAHISYELKTEVPLENVPQFIQNIFSMCLKEAVTNIVKHSEATACKIILKEEKGAWILKIKDNGKGIPPVIETGHGLKGMVERTSFVNGTVEWVNQQGACITIAIPNIISG